MGSPPSPLAIGLAAALVLAPGCAAEEGRDPATAERVYVVNVESHSVSVIDPASMSVVNEIDVGERLHGQIPAPDGRTVYVTTDREGGEVVAIDTATASIAWRVDVGPKLHQPAITLDGRHLYVPEITTAMAFIVDIQERRVAAAIEMRDEHGPLGRLHNAYAGAGGRFVYVTAIHRQTISRIDAATQTVERLYRLSGQPRPVALLSDESKAYVQYSDLHGFVEVDLVTGEETARIEWPEPEDSLPGNTYGAKCHGIGIAPGETELWACSHLEGEVRVYSLPDLKELARVELGERPEWVAFSPDGARVYVTLAGPKGGSGAVAVVDRIGRRVSGTIPVGKEPRRIHSVVVPGGRP